jgi:GNAT superfamily N-acetyltransferase
VVIEPLRSNHDRKHFDCGEESLNRFLSEQAAQYEKKGLGRTYVAVPNDSNLVVGYYTLSMHAVKPGVIPESGLPNKLYTPVTLLGMIGVDKTHQGAGIGVRLLYDALRRARNASRIVAARAVVLGALNDRAKAFYIRHGFQTLTDGDYHMYISIKTIAKLPLP